MKAKICGFILGSLMMGETLAQKGKGNGTLGTNCCKRKDEVLKNGTCKIVRKCRRACKGGKLHPTKFCKCLSQKDTDTWNDEFATRQALCTGKTEKWARCGGKLRKCTMYQKYNWDKCLCERKNYCEKGCGDGKALHPGYTCKCVDFLDEAIPAQYLKEETDAGCGADHYYNSDADYCVAYNWCPKWHECGAGRKWSQQDCDCVHDGSGKKPKKPKKPIKKPKKPTKKPKKPTKKPKKPKKPTGIESGCETGFEWEPSLQYCKEKRGTIPECLTPGKKWSDLENECVWEKDGCSTVRCTAGKQGRWWKNRCQCFSDKAWCRLAKCSQDSEGNTRQGFAFGGKCRCYTLKENCLKRNCGRGKTPGFFDGRCSCYSNIQMCRRQKCPFGQRGRISSDGSCECRTEQENCSKRNCPRGQVGFFWQNKCNCQSKNWICQLKKCGNTKEPTLFKGNCICLLKQDFCSRKKCPRTMEPRWNKGSCRCFLTKTHCDRLKCLPDKEGHWADNWCRCFWKEGSCERKTCAAGQFSAWFKDRCRCFADFDECSTMPCQQGMRGYAKSPGKCGCQKIPGWTPPTGLCDEGQIWSNQYWGCIDRSTTCKSNQVWSEKRKRCIQASCGTNEKWDQSNRKCICNSASYWDDDAGKCMGIECGVGWMYSAASGSCVVNPDYEHECPAKQKWSVDKQRCVCGKGYYYSWKESGCRRVNCGSKRKWSDKQNKCYTPSCTLGQIYYGNKCQCRSDFYQESIRSSCQRIPDCEVGDMWSGDLKRCVEDPDFVGDCRDGEEWSRAKRSCVCLATHYLDKEEQFCKLIDCDGGEQWSKKWTKCRPNTCPRYMEWDDELGSCECVEDRFWSRRQKKCIPIYCPDGYKFNFKYERCDKKTGDDSNPTPPKPKPVEPEIPIDTPDIIRKRKACKHSSIKTWVPERAECVCNVILQNKQCPRGRKYNTTCRCYTRTKDCPRTKSCPRGRKWNGKPNKCLCEKGKRNWWEN